MALNLKSTMDDYSKIPVEIAADWLERNKQPSDDYEQIQLEIEYCPPSEQSELEIIIIQF